MIDNAYNTHKVRRLIQQVETLAARWRQKAALPEIEIRKNIDDSTATMRDVIALIEKETGKNIIDQLRVHLSKFSDVERTLMVKRKAAAQNNTQQALATILLGSGVIILLSFILSAWILRLINRQLNKTAAIAKRVAAGDFSVELTKQDDILSQALRAMVESLQKNQAKLAEEKRKARAARLD